MQRAALVVLTRLVALAPGSGELEDVGSARSRCPPAEEASGSRSLSDSPYGGSDSNCTEDFDRPTDRSSRSRRGEGDLGKEAPRSATKRVGVGMLGVGAGLVVLGGASWLCSRVGQPESARAFCSLVWPFEAGLGGAMMVGGLGVVAYDAWATPEPAPGGRVGFRAGMGLRWAWGP